MQYGVVSSYNLEIKGIRKGYNNVLEPTIQIFRKAVKFYIHLISENWDVFGACKAKQHILLAEKMSHCTKSNPIPQYDFDTQFYKMPCYLRRSAISSAFGMCSSHFSNYANWEKHKQGRAPQLQYNHNLMPSFYYDNMFVGDCFSEASRIKIYNGTDWVWYPVRFRTQDVKYLQKYWSGNHASAPVLTYSHGRYGLRFAFTEKPSFRKTDVKDQLVLAVDLGINNDAVCAVIDAKGTVHARRFINDPCNKDLLVHRINRIKKHQRKQGSQSVQSQWSFINNLHHQISCTVASQIIEFATLYDVDSIVFEYLNIKGSRAQRIHLWRKREIQQLVEHKAHRIGVHVYRINPKNTSALAFDGSGSVVRDKRNYSVCTFKTGKIYNCDLNASYNIGARYFIRELLKPLPVTAASELGAKVPELQYRTQTTLSTLIRLGNVLGAHAA